ncbi:hypothetical protein lerEdw1_000999 [Lerista edwardsae]|nr:hypothetical protein lerEdw1_000999 [Lerista edwardsae]
MDCLLLLLWTLPVAMRNGTSMHHPLTILWLGSIAKSLQLSSLCCASFAAALSGDSSRSSSSVGRFNHDYVFVTPVEVDSRGAYISHDILHSARTKRSTPSSESSLHYKFSAFGQELHLELKPSVLFSHSFSVQVLGKDGLAASQERHVDQCKEMTGAEMSECGLQQGV